MSLFIDLAFGTESKIYDDLIQISRCDPGLSTDGASIYGYPGGIPNTQVLYRQAQQGVFSSNFLLAIINSPYPVTIHGVGSDYMVEGEVLLGGRTVSPDGSKAVHIYIDVTDAMGRGIYVIGTTGTKIPEPQPVILFHELSHVYYWIYDIYDKATSELKAHVDENTFRQQLGMPLRHPTIRDGGKFDEVDLDSEDFPRCDMVAGSGDFSLGHCLVATAATGSEATREVEALRRARARYKDLTLWTSLISGPALRAYSQFSPLIVQDMDRDQALKLAMLTYAVRPVFHFMRAVEAYLETSQKGEDASTRLGEIIAAYCAEAEASGATTGVLRLLADEARNTAAALRRSEAVQARHSQWPTGLYYYLGAKIAPFECGGAFGWAFEAAHILLRQAAERLGGPVRPWDAGEIGLWLARIPVPCDAPLGDSANHELAALGAALFSARDARESFAKHLLDGVRHAARPELAARLESLGFLPAPEPRSTQ